MLNRTVLCTIILIPDSTVVCDLYSLLHILYTLYLYTLSFTLSTLSRIYSNYSIYSPTLLYSTLPTRLYSLLSTVFSILHTLYSSLLYSSPLYSTLPYFTLLYFTIWYCTALYRILPYHTCTAVRICQLYKLCGRHNGEHWPSIQCVHSIRARVGQQCASKLLDSPPAFEQRGLVI